MELILLLLFELFQVTLLLFTRHNILNGYDRVLFSLRLLDLELLLALLFGQVRFILPFLLS